MRSRAVRLTLLSLVLVAVGVSAYLFWVGESQRRFETNASRSYEEQADAAAREILGLRTAQQAYVAAGQGDQFWGEKVTASLARVREALTALRGSSVSPEARTHTDAATSALADFEQMDRRAREYSRGGQKLLASDIIFADGFELTTAAASSLDGAAAAERQARDAALGAAASRQLFALGSAAAAVLLVVMLLVPQPGTDEDTVGLERTAAPVAPAVPSVLDITSPVDEGWSRATRQPAQDVPAPAPVAEPEAPAAVPVAVQSAAPVVDLDTMASLCTELARLVDTRTLPSLLEQAASVLDATGIVLWIADPDGRELSPIVTHGYTQHIVTRLGTILRDAENATAAAFRTSLLQTVKTDAVSNGAIAAPLVSPTGCVGVMAAEVRERGEEDSAKLAAATIVAAQLATLVGPPSSRTRAEAAG